MVLFVYNGQSVNNAGENSCPLFGTKGTNALCVQVQKLSMSEQVVPVVTTMIKD